MKAEITVGIEKHLNDCPACGAADQAIMIIDGDSIDMGEAIPRHACKGYAFHPVLGLHQCALCGAESFTIELDLIDNADVDGLWINKYFRRNEAFECPEAPFTVKLSGFWPPALPSQWKLWRTPTGRGILERHCFGPFVQHGSLRSWNGVSRCARQKVWMEAAEMLGRAWPVLAAMKHATGIFSIQPEKGLWKPTQNS
jgi:hypothetical protein